MNSNYYSNTNPRKPNPSSQPGSVNSFSNYQFDFGIPSSRQSSNQPLKDQKNPNQSHPRPTFSHSQSSSSWTTTPNKPSWTHQPSTAASPNLSNQTSMVGDILGKSWSSNSSTGIGIVDAKNPNLFGDLLGSALGPGKTAASNVPLKNISSNSSINSNSSNANSISNSFSMNNLKNSLPNSGVSANLNGGNGGHGFGGYRNTTTGAGTDTSRISTKKDPFGSLFEFGNSSAMNKNTSRDSSFGDFKTTPKANFDSFGDLKSAPKEKTESFGAPMREFASAVPPPPMSAPSASAQSGSVDPFDTLFPSSSGAAAATPAGGGLDFGSKVDSEVVDDWGLDSEFGGSGVGDGGGSTIELEGLPPPPNGVTASMAKGKGLDHHKQGQYADAIKWLSWAVLLLEKSGGDSASGEILSCRASCYKEVGEYKKAISDCSKVLEKDGTNVSVLIQRALLYESSEKYKLGADDLRAVLKTDPGNRIARSTIHRLNKMAD